MPVTTFSAANVRTSSTSFPKLKLDRNAKGRIVCIEPNPVFEWVHELKKPVVSRANGKPVMDKREGRDGESYEVYQMEFIGRSVCVGDPDVLEDRGMDPDHCPACKLAKDSDMLPGPSRRYAIHILQYTTQPGSSQISQPFSVATRVWTLTENRYAQMVELMKEAGVEDPRQVDIILEMKENVPEAFQNYTMKAGRQCEMLTSKDNASRALETYQNSHAADLSPYCGRKVEAKYIKEDCEDIVAAWHKVRRAEQGDAEMPAPLDPEAVTLDASILDNVGAGAVSPPVASAPASTQPIAPVIEAPVEGDGVVSAEVVDATTSSNPEEKVENAPAPSPGQFKPVAEQMNFTDLLASLQ